jgi:hypothetical protein
MANWQPLAEVNHLWHDKAVTAAKTRIQLNIYCCNNSISMTSEDGFRI